MVFLCGENPMTWIFTALKLDILNRKGNGFVAGGPIELRFFLKCEHFDYILSVTHLDWQWINGLSVLTCSFLVPLRDCKKMMLYTKTTTHKKFLKSCNKVTTTIIKVDSATTTEPRLYNICVCIWTWNIIIYYSHEKGFALLQSGGQKASVVEKSFLYY